MPILCSSELHTKFIRSEASNNVPEPHSRMIQSFAVVLQSRKKEAAPDASPNQINAQSGDKAITIDVANMTTA